MNRLLSLLPKNVMATLAIGGGILFIVLSQPPHDVCDAQIDTIKRSQRSFLWREKPNSEVMKSTKYQYLRGRCQGTNDPGGCYELFRAVRALLQDMDSLSEACGTAAGSVAEIKKALWETIELLIRLAWGDKPPASTIAKFGWLDVADVTLYCKLKARLTGIFGDPAWTSFRERMMADLPEAKTLTRNQIWDLSLFSENCARYP